MTKPASVTRKLLLAVLSALTFVIAGPDPPSFANYRHRCKPLGFLKHAIPSFNEAEWFLNVPVVVHYMYNPDVPAADYNGLFPWHLVPPGEIAELFSLADLDDPEIKGGNVNEIWKQAGVHFVLKRLEKCQYTERDYPFNEVACEYACSHPSGPTCKTIFCYGQCPYLVPHCEQQCSKVRCDVLSRRLAKAGTLEEAMIPDPAPQVKTGFFRWVNGHYNATDYCAHRQILDRQCTTTPMRRGVDVYVWWKMQVLAGFSASDFDDAEPVVPKEDPQRPPGPGAVWISGYQLGREVLLPGGNVGFVFDRFKAARLLAHELGHFLGLCHACAGLNSSTCVNQTQSHRELRVECGAQNDYTQRSSAFFADTPRNECDVDDGMRLMHPDWNDVRITAVECSQAYGRAIPHARAPANQAPRGGAAPRTGDVCARTTGIAK